MHDGKIDIFEKEIVIDVRFFAVDADGNRINEFELDWSEPVGFNAKIDVFCNEYHYLFAFLFF